MPPIARVGDVHDCPRHGKNAIVSGGQATADGRPIARVGDKCGCGATIIDGASSGSQDGKPVAYQGSKTSCGGVITTGSPTHSVKV
ncbi:PAAR domain-containing protein [Yoonia maritima]|uniref:PAAR domain-containing protein n=1 Tax=Yoonia maritima TaxID=1435347 RepID=UPI000D10E3D2|nr:PAAR domain-containing protein [Yoonia maritima]